MALKIYEVVVTNIQGTRHEVIEFFDKQVREGKLKLISNDLSVENQLNQFKETKFCASLEDPTQTITLKTGSVLIFKCTPGLVPATSVFHFEVVKYQVQLIG
jgi:hypothetical protein